MVVTFLRQSTPLVRTTPAGPGTGALAMTLNPASAQAHFSVLPLVNWKFD